MQIRSLSVHRLTQARPFSQHRGQLDVFISLPQAAFLLFRQILLIDDSETITSLYYASTVRTNKVIIENHPETLKEFFRHVL